MSGAPVTEGFPLGLQWDASGAVRLADLILTTSRDQLPPRALASQMLKTNKASEEAGSIFDAFGEHNAI
jgi:hypothetical protein